jgi:diphthine methyl ester acylhydrolase
MESELLRTHTWKAHEYETWIAAYDAADPNIIYTGADDCYLRLWDLRMIDNDESQKPHTISTKRFDMGVTAIQSYFHTENLFLMGSYNENGIDFVSWLWLFGMYVCIN